MYHEHAPPDINPVRVVYSFFLGRGMWKLWSKRKNQRVINLRI